MLIRSKVSMAVSSRFLRGVGFQNAPPFLSLFVSVQFQSPPMTIFAVSDLSTMKLFNLWMNSSCSHWLLGA